MAQDRLSLKIDALTTKQTTLQDGLPSLQSFQDELVTYLDTITAAGPSTTGGETSMDTTSALAILSAAVETSRHSESPVATVRLTAVPDGLALAAAEPLANSASVAAVPEPASLALVAAAIVVAAAVRRRVS